MKSICGLDLVCGPQLANHCLERNSWSKCVAFVCLLESSACSKVTYVMALVYFRKDLGLAYTFAWSYWHIHFWHMWISGSHQGTLHRRIIWKVPPKHSSSGPSVDQWHQAVCREPRQLQYFFKCTPGDCVYDCSWVKSQQIRAMAFKLSPSADAPRPPLNPAAMALIDSKSGAPGWIPRVAFSRSFPCITADLGATLQSHCHREWKIDPAKILPSAEISQLACLTALPRGVSVPLWCGLFPPQLRSL